MKFLIYFEWSLMFTYFNISILSLLKIIAFHSESILLTMKIWIQRNGTAQLKKCKQLFEYRHLLLLSDTWWLKF